MLPIFFLGCATSPSAPGSYRGYQSPTYNVVSSQGAIEVCQYAPYLVAQVTVEGSCEESISKGFRLLAGYIFGGNEGNASIAMTSPVVQSPSVQIAMTSPVTQVQNGNLWTVQFSMPSSYTLQTLPAAKNSAIEFLQIPEHRTVAIRFSGFATGGALRKNQEKLKDYINAQGLQTIGSVGYAYYDDPFTLPWNRRNEVFYRLDK